MSRKRLAAFIVAILCLLGLCGAFIAKNNHPQLVYGPPPEYDPSNNIEPDVYGPPVGEDVDYDPADNVPDCVYGPPESFE